MRFWLSTSQSWCQRFHERYLLYLSRMVTKMQFDSTYNELLKSSTPLAYPIFTVILNHCKYEMYLNKLRRQPQLVENQKILQACDANITQFTEAQIKENIFSIMQEENNLASPSKKRYHDEPLVQALDISMMRGLTKVGYRALLEENEKSLPSDINTTLSTTCETDEQKVIHLAQIMLDSPMLDNIAYACNKHYVESNANRVPLYERKSWKSAQK